MNCLYRKLLLRRQFQIGLQASYFWDLKEVEKMMLERYQALEQTPRLGPLCSEMSTQPYQNSLGKPTVIS